MAMSYTKSASIDIGKDGVPAKGKATITEETMHDLPDSDNEDDDAVLINGGRGSIFSETTDRKARWKYSGLVLKLLLVFLIAGVLVLSYFVHLLQNDLKTMHQSLNAQKSELSKNKVTDQSTSKELSGKLENVTNLIKRIPNAEKLTKLDSTLTMVYNRGSLYYPKFNARFIGFGYPSNRSNWEDHSRHTLEQCLERLYEKRKTDKSWNGVVFAHKKRNGWCINYKTAGLLDVKNLSYMYYAMTDD